MNSTLLNKKYAEMITEITTHKLKLTCDDYKLIIDKLIEELKTEGYLTFRDLPTDVAYNVSKDMIRYLRYVDTSDKQALNIAYTLFVRTSKDTFKLDDLAEVVNNIKENN